MATKRKNELAFIKGLIIDERYDYSSKVRKHIERGDYQEEDLEHCICTAARIRKIEKDEQHTASDGRKYTILGRDMQGENFYTCGKLMLAENGEVYFFITAHQAE